jgi:hypothetical protein
MKCNQLKCVSQDYFYKLGIYVVTVGNHKEGFQMIQSRALKN